MNEMVKNILEMIIFVVITGCGMYILKCLSSFLNKKIDEIQTTTALSKYTQLNKYIDTAQEAITTAVTSVSQTYVDSLKEQGKFDEAAATTAKEKATTVAKNLISEDGKEAIKTIFGDFELYLSNMIETVVKLNK